MANIEIIVQQDNDTSCWGTAATREQADELNGMLEERIRKYVAEKYPDSDLEIKTGNHSSDVQAWRGVAKADDIAGDIEEFIENEWPRCLDDYDGDTGSR